MTRRELFAVLSSGLLARPAGGRVVFIEMSGGPSQVDTFDFQPGPWTPAWMAPVRHRDSVFPAGLMPNLARMLDRVTLVRGIESPSLIHRGFEPGWPFLRASATTFETACDQARSILRSGTHRVHIRLGSWDHHGDLYEQLRGIGTKFDSGVAALITQLNSTTIVAMGEFGRQPGPLNQNGGRDHYRFHAALQVR